MTETDDSTDANTDTDSDTNSADGSARRSQCGFETTDGTPCQLPVSRKDGRCHHHTNADGRPSKLTYERQEGIATMIEQGQSMTAAARAHSISKTTIFNWLQRGEAEKQVGHDNEYTDFLDRITRARGKGEQLYVSQLRTMAAEEGDTATLMAMLKQRYPDSWGEVDRGEQTGGVNVYLEPEETTEIDPETLEVVGTTDDTDD